MEIYALWVVTKPTADAELQDICFKTDLPRGLYLQFMGGLEPDEIVGFYTDQKSAEEVEERESHAFRQTAADAARHQALKEQHDSALHAALEAWKYAESLVEAGLAAGTLDYAAVEAARAEARRLTDLECQLYNLLNRKG